MLPIPHRPGGQPPAGPSAHGPAGPGLPPPWWEADPGLRRIATLVQHVSVLVGLGMVGAGLPRIFEFTLISNQFSGILLFAVGGWLTLAGHRGRQYQSQYRLAAYHAGLIRRSHAATGPDHEHPG